MNETGVSSASLFKSVDSPPPPHKEKKRADIIRKAMKKTLNQSRKCEKMRKYSRVFFGFGGPHSLLRQLKFI